MSTAWVSVSADPVHGAYQKGMVFWKKIHDNCILHREADGTDKIVDQPRTVEQLTNRFNRQIA